MDHDVFCGQCGLTGAVGRVTASLACPGCGSNDIGLLGLDEFPAHLAAKDKDGHETSTKKEGPKGKRHEDDADDVKAETGSSGPKARKGQKPWEIDSDKAEKRKKESAAANPYPTRGSGGSGWNQTMPDPLRGWSDYAGPPPPGQNDPYQPGRDMSHNTTTCPVCRGTGYDVQDKTVCRECGGFGKITHPTEPSGPVADLPKPGMNTVPQVGPVRASRVEGARPSANPLDSFEYYQNAYSPDYRHRNREVKDATTPHGWVQSDMETYFPRADVHSPMTKLRETPGHGYAQTNAPHVMNGAWCPQCGHDDTQLERDKNDDAWWVCPNCGPLANIDKNPQVNPYDTDDDFEPNRNMKRASRFRRAAKKTGRIFRIMASVQAANQLTDREAFELARRTVAAYPEKV